MNAFELSGKTPDGKTASVWACGKCLRFAPLDPSKEAAEKCCRPTLCACGVEVGGFRTKCDACWKKERDAKDQTTFDKAKKTPHLAYSGMLFCECCEHFYHDVDELIDDHWDHDEIPTWAWACTERRLAIDASEVIANALESQEWFEDAADHIPGDLSALQRELDSSAAAIPPCQEVDYSEVVTFEGVIEEATAERSQEKAQP